MWTHSFKQRSYNLWEKWTTYEKSEFEQEIVGRTLKTIMCDYNRDNYNRG